MLFDVSWAFFHLLHPPALCHSSPHPLIVSHCFVVVLSFSLAWWQHCHCLAVLEWHLFPPHEQLLMVVVLGAVVVAVIVVFSLLFVVCHHIPVVVVVVVGYHPKYIVYLENNQKQSIS
jgi:hypothetical protein